MKKVLALMAIAVTFASCSSEDVVCCDGGTSSLYAGQSDICYGDNLASTNKDQDEWVAWMEGIGCNCN